jgi:hypothetical protein
MNKMMSFCLNYWLVLHLISKYFKGIAMKTILKAIYLILIMKSSLIACQDSTTKPVETTRTFFVENNTGEIITTGFVRTPGSSSWNNQVLSSELSDGETQSITLAIELMDSDFRIDIQLRKSNGISYTKYSQAITNNKTITFVAEDWDPDNHRTVDIQNNTSIHIYNLYARAPGTMDWGINIITEPIRSNDSMTVSIPIYLMDSDFRSDIMVVSSENMPLFRSEQTIDGSTVEFINESVMIGPAWGLVFHDKGFYSNGWRFLELSPYYTQTSAPWGAMGHNVAGTLQTIGSGRRNTELIVARLAQLGETGMAAQICDELTVNGYSDWFLPSSEELRRAQQNFHQLGFIVFNYHFYWSSSQSNANNAWAIIYSTNQPRPTEKYYSVVVRAIRAF